MADYVIETRGNYGRIRRFWIIFLSYEKNIPTQRVKTQTHPRF